MIKRILVVLIGICAYAIAAQAQTITKSQEYSAFSTIEVGDTFNVSFKPSETGNYMAEWTVDTALENDSVPFTQTTALGRTAHHQ